MDRIMILVQILQILALPAIIVFGFIHSLRSYLRTPKENTEDRKNLMIQLIISGGLTLLVVVFLIWLIVVFSSPVNIM